MKNSRNTVSTRRRQDNTRKLIAELEKRDMMADDICFFFGYSPSGARKYIRDLIADGVLELARYVEGTATYIGKAVYRLTPDRERVRDFLATLDHDALNRPEARARAGRGHSAPDNSRKLHIMVDDAYCRIKPEPVVCRRDDLVAALFGAVGVVA